MQHFLLLSSLAVTGLAGCGSAQLFGAYPVPPSETAADAAWPRLVDTPEAPAKGSYSDTVPDPAKGIAIQADLGQAAQASALRAEALRDPVLTDAERKRLLRR